MKKNVGMASFIVWLVKFRNKIAFYAIMTREKCLVCVVS